MRLIALLVLCLATTVAAAQPYAFAGVSHTTVKGDFGGSSDASPTVVIGGGYRFARVALEASYLDTGKATSIERQPSATANVVSVSTFETKGLGLFALYRAPVAQSLHAFAKAGAYRLTSSMTTRITEQDNLPPFNTRILADGRGESVWAPGIGLGGELAIGSGALRASLEVVKGGAIEQMRNVTFDFVLAF